MKNRMESFVATALIKDGPKVDWNLSVVRGTPFRTSFGRAMYVEDGAKVFRVRDVETGLIVCSSNSPKQAVELANVLEWDRDGIKNYIKDSVLPPCVDYDELMHDVGMFYIERLDERKN